MDIGAEISKKIQMAITAKLKELNAYVDDELPDYIMIMVANRKTEAQMAEALSLFLSGNTKAFTSWLHNLLATLRKARTGKKDSANPSQKPFQVSSIEQETKLLHETILLQDELNAETVVKEPVISINPESDDILDKELHADTPTYCEIKTSDITESQGKKSSCKLGAIQGSIEKSSLPSMDIKFRSSATNQRQSFCEGGLQMLHSDNRQSNANLKQSQKVQRSGKIGQAISSTRKHRKLVVEKKPNIVMVKQRRSLQELSIKSDKALKKTEKPKGSLSSTVSQVALTSAFTSDSSGDDDINKHQVSSKVAYPKRKIRVPLKKQANKALLMRAVSEAEKSVRKRTHTSVAEEKVQVRKDKMAATAQVKKMDCQSQVKRQKREFSQPCPKIKEGFSGPDGWRVSEVSRGGKRSHQDNSAKEKKKPSPSVPELQQNKTPEVRNTEGKLKPHSPLHCDRRKFIIHEMKADGKEDFTSSAKFDSRKTKLVSDTPPQESLELGKKQRITARVPPRPHNPDNQQLKQALSAVPCTKTSSDGPVFIVTLDGVVSSKQTVCNNTGFLHEPDIEGENHKLVTVPQSHAQLQQSAKQLILPKPQKQSFEAKDEGGREMLAQHSSHTELAQMKKKILELQAESAKLRKLQASLVAVQSSQQTATAEVDCNSQMQDKCSVCVCNVHFSTTEKQLSDYFSICGKVSRVTILKDMSTGLPKGFAYLEFEDERSVSSALALNNSRLNNRVIRVMLKQRNSTARFRVSRGRYHRRRPVIETGGFRGLEIHRSRKHSVKFGTHNMQQGNRTWVNPSLAKK